MGTPLVFVALAVDKGQRSGIALKQATRASLVDRKFTLSCPLSAFISSLPPVRQMSGCSNLPWVIGIEAGQGSAEHFLSLP